MVWIAPALLFLVMIAVLIVRRRLPKTTNLAVCEYWVYIREPKLPKIEAIMNAMISENPHNRPGRPCIGAREGMLFSDIRLHMAIARRDKNPHIFRPDLFHEAVTPSAEVLARLSESKAIAKVRYLSEEPLSDPRHLQFMPHLAETISRLTDGLAVFDVTQDAIFTSEEFFTQVSESPNQERIDKHARVVWLPTGDAGKIETRGLQKLGLPELHTNDIPLDERSVVTLVVEEVLGRMWKTPPTFPAEYEFEVLGQLFRVRATQATLSRADITVSRVRGQ